MSATRIEPNTPAAWFNEGSAFEMAGQSAEALERYEHAVALDSTYAAAYINIGRLRIAAGQLDAARDAYEHAVSADATNAEQGKTASAVYSWSSVQDVAVTVNQ